MKFTFGARFVEQRLMGLQKPSVKQPVSMPHLSPSFSGALRQFSFWIANGSAGHHSCIFHEPSALEQVYAIFANVIELDERGQVVNAKFAEKRAAQYILQYVAGEQAEPPFEGWEVELH